MKTISGNDAVEIPGLALPPFFLNFAIIIVLYLLVQPQKYVEDRLDE